jgi:hypothetical protein
MLEDDKVYTIRLQILNESDRKQWIISPDISMWNYISVYDKTGNEIKRLPYFIPAPYPYPLDEFGLSNEFDSQFIQLEAFNSYFTEINIKKYVNNNTNKIYLDYLGMLYEIPIGGMKFVISFYNSDYEKELFSEILPKEELQEITGSIEIELEVSKN